MKLDELTKKLQEQKIKQEIVKEKYKANERRINEMVKEYRKKPVVIEALLLEESVDSQESAVKWCGGKKGPDGGVYIDTLEGKMYTSTGDYIIRGVDGEFYPCKPEIFEKTYEKV